MFDSRVTSDIHSFVLQIASVSLGDLMESMRAGHRYGYVGTEDGTMYPLIRPGAIVRIDESRQRISSGPWATESERPIYFLETRSGFACCWCAVMEGNIILQPHPLSPQPVRILSLSEELWRCDWTDSPKLAERTILRFRCRGELLLGAVAFEAGEVQSSQAG